MLRFELRRRRSDAGARGRDARRRRWMAARAPSACPARARAHRRQHRRSRQPVQLTRRRTPSLLLRRYRSLILLYPTGLGKNFKSLFLIRYLLDFLKFAVNSRCHKRITKRMQLWTNNFSNYCLTSSVNTYERNIIYLLLKIINNLLAYGVH